MNLNDAISRVSIDEPEWSFTAGKIFRDTVEYEPYRKGEDFVSKVYSANYNEIFLGMYEREELEEASTWIDKSRDDLMDYIGSQAMATRYQLNDGQGRLVETPQERFLVVALYLADGNMELAREAYETLSQLKMTVATPTLANSGKTYGQLSSCFILTPEDSLEGIYHSVTEAARLSKGGGGIGVYAGFIRSRGSSIAGNKGKSSGTIPFLKLFDATAVAVDQLGTRKGAIAVFQDVWHPDIRAFLDLRLNNGDEATRAHNLNLGVSLPDRFMEAVDADADWYLIDPQVYRKHFGHYLSDLWGEKWNEAYDRAVAKGIHSDTVKAKAIWRAILRAQVETGFPYMFYRDTVNAMNPNKHMGTIYSTNLCVAPETKILTRELGYVAIEEVVGEKVHVWNGTEWSLVTPQITSHTPVELLRVHLDSSAPIDSTPEHIFYVQEGFPGNGGKVVQKRAHELEPGDRLAAFDLPIIEGEDEDDRAYASGFHSGDGCVFEGNKITYLYGEKKALLPYMGKYASAYETEGSGDRITLTHHDVWEKFAVPGVSYTIATRLAWLAGVVDADGTVARNGEAEGIQLGSVNKEFLYEVQLMLQTLGVPSKVTLAKEAGRRMMPANDGSGELKEFDCQAAYRLHLSPYSLYRLSELGFETKRLKWTARKPAREARRFTVVTEVERTGRKDITMCFTEPINHTGMFNGVMTGQCTEIFQVQSPNKEVYRTISNNGTISEKYTAGYTVTCNLSSLTLPRIIANPLVDGRLHEDDLDELKRIIKLQVTLLDNVITLNNLPSVAAQHTNELFRAVGAGVSGWHQLLAQLGIHWESQEAVDFSDYLWEIIAFQTIQASSELAEQRGAYPLFGGSDWQTGEYFTQRGYDSPEWKELAARVAKKGIRNGYLMAVAPTGSTSIISGATAGLDAVTDIYYTEEKKDIRVPVVVPNLTSETYPYYKPAYLIDQSFTIKQAAARQRHLDQGQSLNLYLNGDIETQGGGKKAVKLSNWHFQAWREKLKATYYIRSRTVMAESCVWCE